MNFAVAILGLAALILIHEAGHFLVARAVGMNPRKFYLGFPPALVKTVRKGIEYGIGTVPLGGYVKIPGMHRPAAGDVDELFGPAVRELPGLERALAAVRQGLAAEDYETAARELQGVRALGAVAGLSPQAAKALERGLTEIGDACAPDAYWRARTWKRVAVILAGPGANFLVAIALFWLVFTVSYGPATNKISQVGATIAAKDGREVPSPAAQAGIKPGDRIFSIGGAATPDGDAVIEAVRASGGKPVRIVVERGGARLTLGPVAPVLTRYKDETADRWRVGITPAGSGYPVGEAGWRAMKGIGIVSRETVKSLGNLVHKSGRDQVSSPVGIVRESAKAASAGWEPYVTLLAFISLSLGLLNLLPLLPLDGGHIAVSLVEGIRGRAFAKEAYMRISMIGIAVVLMLFFIGLTNDVGGRGG